MMDHFPTTLKYSAPVARMARWYFGARTRGLEKVVFTATTGRSGTKSLEHLFAAIPGCKAFHEPYPNTAGQWLLAASQGRADEVRRYYERIKAINIRRDAAGARYYVELNHLFIKTFIEYAVQDFGDRLEVIHLVRPALEVAASIYHLRDWPGTETGNFWWLDYRAPTNLIQLSDLLDADAALSHPFYKALWYWYETEARVHFWRQRLPQVRFHRFETHWINDADRTLALLDGLGIEYDRGRLLSLVGFKTHTKEQRSKVQSSDLENARGMHEHFREVLAGRGLLPTDSPRE